MIGFSASEDLDLLERWLRQIQVEWDKFFAGVENKPPHELKTRLEVLIRKYAGGEIRNNTERFRYQTLSSRYSALNEMWGRRLRALEEGRPISGVRAPAPLAASVPVGPTTEAPRRRDVQPVRVNEAERESAVRTLYDRYIEARRDLGNQAPVKYESFERLITQQTSRILADKGAQAVDFRLETKGGKVSLKAKPIR